MHYSRKAIQITKYFTIRQSMAISPGTALETLLFVAYSQTSKCTDTVQLSTSADERKASEIH